MTSIDQGLVVQSIVNIIALRKAKIVYNFGLSECSRANELVKRSTH